MMSPPPIDTLDRWMEQPPEDAPASWCLPGWGGPIKVRAFDVASCTFTPVRGSERWAIETCVVPLVAHDDYPETAGQLDAGDCVVFIDDFGDTDDSATGYHAVVDTWMPQRILEVTTIDAKHQFVVSIIDRHYGNPRPEQVEQIEKRFLSEPMLIKDHRRAVLERFQLNVDCPVCAGQGRPVVYGLLSGPPLGDEIIGGCALRGDDPDYLCSVCNAGWRVDIHGTLGVVELADNDEEEVPSWAVVIERGEDV